MPETFEGDSEEHLEPTKPLIRPMLFADIFVVMRGGGDLASGAAIRLVRAGFPLLITELEQPLAVRRAVSFASAVIDGHAEIEGIPARRIPSAALAQSFIASGFIPVLVDPAGEAIRELRPRVLVDARLLKRNIDTRATEAPLVIGLGPGFTAGFNCHAFVETSRGHMLGRVCWEGKAEENTGIPERIGGQDALRVLRAPCSGVFRAAAAIGDQVAGNQVVASVGAMSIPAPFDGVVRGLIADGIQVPAGLKVGDIDPRGKRSYCLTVSDKALAVGGGVVDAVLTWINQGFQRRC